MVKFLFLVSFLLSIKAIALPMTLLLEQAPPAYYQKINQKFYDWYINKNHLTLKLQSDETKFIKLCLQSLTDWSYQMAPNTYWNRLRFATALSSQEVVVTSIAVGPSEWTPELTKLANKILAQRHVNFKNISQVLWFEWDLQSGAFSLYFKDELSLAESVRFNNNYYKPILREWTFTKKQKTEKIYASYKEIPEVVQQSFIFHRLITDVVAIIEKDEVIDRIFELKSFDDRFIDEPLKSLANSVNNEFRFLADSMIYRSHRDLVLYYP